MKKVLIIDDDPVVLAIYQGKYQNAGLDVETATDGESGLKKVEASKPDLLQLDLMLPKFNGIEIINVLRSHDEWRTMPIIVLSNTYNSDMIKEAWIAGATDCISKLDTSPNVVLQRVQQLLSANDEPSPNGELFVREGRSQLLTRNKIDSIQREMHQEFTKRAGLFRISMKNELRNAFSNNGKGADATSLLDLFRTVHSVAGHSAIMDFRKIAHLASALEVLIKDMHADRHQVTASTRGTITGGINALCDMLERTSNYAGVQCDEALVLAVDDEIICRETLCAALRKAGLKALSVNHAGLALNILVLNKFDLVFLDIEMPGMNGLELCRKLRADALNKDTPVVFVTALTDYENRIRSAESGGNDFIAKPFLMSELAVKALTWILRSSTSS